MQDKPMKLSDCVENYVQAWHNDYKAEAESGNLESMLIYSRILKRGSKNIRPDINQSFHWLKKACKNSPEAAFKLWMAYKKVSM